MEKSKNILLIGGDLRQTYIAEEFSNEGYNVGVLGLDKYVEFSDKITKFQEITDAVKEADIILLPLPCSKDDEFINTPFSDKEIQIDTLLKSLTKNQIVLLGYASEKVNNKLNIYNIYHIDYYDNEELMIKNAIPTAEGAIGIAIEETAITLHSSNCLVVGFGRISKILAKMLKGLDVNVTVCARKKEDLCWIETLGYTPIELKNLEDNISDNDIIFNTVPHCVITEDLLKKVKKDCLIIDLASKPGGVDFMAAKELGIKVIWALSLPYKVAFKTAGKFMKDTIKNILNELGVL